MGTKLSNVLVHCWWADSVVTGKVSSKRKKNFNFWTFDGRTRFVSKMFKILYIKLLLGALVIGLRNPQLFCSISAFAPICNPTSSPWGQKAFTGEDLEITNSTAAFQYCLFAIFRLFGLRFQHLEAIRRYRIGQTIFWAEAPYFNRPRSCWSVLRRRTTKARNSGRS